MIKKIKIDQLKPGMFVHDFNCAWMKHPFLGTSMQIKNDRMIEKIAECGMQELYIDTEKGRDVPDAPTEQEAGREIEAELHAVAEKKSLNSKRVSLSEEMVKAKKIKTEAKLTVQHIMEEIRFGRPVETERVEPVVEKIIESVFRNQDALISLGQVKEVDEYTYVHSMSVCVLMISFGKYLGYDSGLLKEVGIGAMLHDIGKMRIPLAILNSTGKLTDSEYDQIKRHVEYSNSLLAATEGIPGTSVTLASEHHERFNGTGYPHGKKGDEISSYGQAAAIADVYDAMTSKRCYQRRYEPTDVLKKLFEWKDHFRRELVQHFVRCVGIYPVGSLVRLESGFLAVVSGHNEEDLLRPVVRAVYDVRGDKFIFPLDIDLSKTGGSDRILCPESREKWKIMAERYL